MVILENKSKFAFNPVYETLTWGEIYMEFLNKT